MINVAESAYFWVATTCGSESTCIAAAYENVTFTATSGTTYYIIADAYTGMTPGPFHFRLIQN
jgi:hypothetical protein